MFKVGDKVKVRADYKAVLKGYIGRGNADPKWITFFLGNVDPDEVHEVSYIADQEDCIMIKGDYLRLNKKAFIKHVPDWLDDLPLGDL